MSVHELNAEVSGPPVHCSRCEWEGRESQLRSKTPPSCPSCAHYAIEPGPRMRDAIHSRGEMQLTLWLRVQWCFWIALGGSPTYAIVLPTENEVGHVGTIEMSMDLSWPAWFPRRRETTVVSASGSAPHVCWANSHDGGDCPVHGPRP